MKILSSLLGLIFLAGCGTAVKIQYDGDVVKEEKKAPVLLVYKVSFPNDRHEIFFWDEDHNRFNLKVEGNYDTTKGIIIYLPANRNYALSGFLHVKPSWGTDYSFGTELQLFHVTEDRVTQIPYFELVELDDGHFRIKQTPIDNQEPYLVKARKNFAFSLPLKTVKAF